MTPFEVVLRGLPIGGRGTPERDKAVNRWFEALQKLTDDEVSAHGEHIIHRAAGGYP